MQNKSAAAEVPMLPQAPSNAHAGLSDPTCRFLWTAQITRTEASRRARHSDCDPLGRNSFARAPEHGMIVRLHERREHHHQDERNSWCVHKSSTTSKPSLDDICPKIDNNSGRQ
jgi:hypothetical protein